MDEPPRSDTPVPETVQRLVEQTAAKGTGKVLEVSFDANQRAMSRPPHWPSDTCLAPGEHCTPRYMITDYLGRGGIAQVFEARDMLDETFEAIKAVRIDGARAEILEKVAAEAQSLKRIRHPNVLCVHDAGILPDKKLLWVAMERLVGGTLQQRIAHAAGPRATPRRPAIPVLEALRIGVAIARGVHAIHEAKIIHRDIKPENVFVTTSGSVKVIDLNIAKFSESCGVRTTEPGITMGTVHYMSPEHLHEGTADVRSDIYAIGFVLFEMVAGHHAFASGLGDMPRTNDVIAWHKTRMPPKLSLLGCGAPLALDGIIRKCTDKDPDRRYQRCPDLFADLLSLEALLLEAEAAAAQLASRSFGPGGKRPEPEVVVRASAGTPPPGLPLATTERTATAIPSTPFDFLPPPIFDPPAAVAPGSGVPVSAATANPATASATTASATTASATGASPMVMQPAIRTAAWEGGAAAAAAVDVAAPASTAAVSVERAAGMAASSGVRRVESASGSAAAGEGAATQRGASSPPAATPQAPATLRAGGPAGTDMMVPISANPAAPLLGRGGTEIMALPHRAPPASGSARPASESTQPRAREETGTAELPLSGTAGGAVERPAHARTAGPPEDRAAVAERGARAAAAPAVSAQDVLPAPATASARASGPASRREATSRRGRTLAWRMAPYGLCMVFGVALASALWAWAGRGGAPAAAPVSTASAAPSAVSTTATATVTASTTAMATATTTATASSAVEVAPATPAATSSATARVSAPGASAAAKTITPWKAPAVPSPTAVPSAPPAAPPCKRKPLPTNPCPKSP